MVDANEKSPKKNSPYHFLKMLFYALLIVKVVFHVGPQTLEKFKSAFFVNKYLIALKDEPVANSDKIINCDVLVVGGGTGGTAAAIQSARLGARTCLTEETDWLGGMLTSAGVSSMDGRERNYHGLLKEFIDRVEIKYKNQPYQTHQCFAPFCFEPQVGAEVLKEMAAAEPYLFIYYETKLDHVLKNNNRINGAIFKTKEGTKLTIQAKVTIAADQSGDFLYLGDVPFDLGVEKTDEPHANQANDCTQPVTYVALIRDTGKKIAPIPKPADYNEKNYQCLIPNKNCPSSTTEFRNWNFFLGYGHFPYGKIMVNVPNRSFGNDFFHTNPLHDQLDRDQIIQKSKNHTLGLVYYIQTVLGKNTYELVKNEFGTSDGLAKIPYERESRRGRGMVRLKEQDLLPDPITGISRFWPDSIAVGDYFLDLHRCQSGQPDLFINIPPFQLPYGVLVPATIDGLLFAEHNISVSHIGNGATRLQPIIMETGKAAGLAAALASLQNIEPRQVNVAQMQKILVDTGSRVNFYEDIPVQHYAFTPISLLTQKQIVSGYKNYLFGKDNPVSRGEFSAMLIKAFGVHQNNLSKKSFSFADIQKTDWYAPFAEALPADLANFFPDKKFRFDQPLTRSEAAHWISAFFELNKPIKLQASFKKVFKDMSEKNPYKDDLEILVKLGIIKGAGDYITPDKKLTRAEATTMVQRLEEKIARP